jgi:hypothetical protein
MKISKINGQPYSEEIVSKIHDKSIDFIIRERIRGATDPYHVCATKDELTLLFENTDTEEKSISLPFRTNVEQVYNTTNYNGKGKLIVNLLRGKPDYVRAERLTDFLNYLNGKNVTSMQVIDKYVDIQDANWNVRDDKRHVLSKGKDKTSPKGTTLDEKLANSTEQLTLAECGFNIDPDSFVRVEKRTGKKEDTYTVSLSFEKYIGLGGLPGVHYYRTRQLKVRVAK